MCGWLCLDGRAWAANGSKLNLQGVLVCLGRSVDESVGRLSSWLIRTIHKPALCGQAWAVGRCAWADMPLAHAPAGSR